MYSTQPTLMPVDDFSTFITSSLFKVLTLFIAITLLTCSFAATITSWLYAIITVSLAIGPRQLCTAHRLNVYAFTRQLPLSLPIIIVFLVFILILKVIGCKLISIRHSFSTVC